MSNQEKKNNRIGVLTSLGVHTAMFLAFFFLMAWRAPNPPLEEYGIELNFGLDPQGSGDVQPVAPVGEETEKEADASVQPESQPEEVKTDEKEAEKEVAPDKAVEQAVSKLESDVAAKEEKKASKTESTKPAESKPAEKVEIEYKKPEKKVTDPAVATKKGETGSQGADAKKTGDTGSSEGTLAPGSTYGTPGGGGGGDGMNLSMGGWAWASPPQVPELPDNENGKVIFEIECDASGEIIGITTLERSLSPKAEQILKEEIRKNSLVKTSDGAAPERSKGKIVFVLKTK